MSAEALVFIALIVIAAVIVLGLSLVPPYTARLTRRLPRFFGLTMPRNLEPVIRARAVRRERGAVFGALLMTLLTIPALIAAHSDPALPTILRENAVGETWLLIGAVATGGALGTALASVLQPARQPDRLRVARSRSVGLADYIGGLERNGARILATLGVLGGIATLLLGWFDVVRFALEPASGARIALCAFTALALVAFEVLGRRVVGRPAPAGSPRELAWDDALRAATVRDLAGAPTVLGLFASAAVALDIILMVAAPGSANQTLVTVIAVGAATAFLAGTIIAIVAIVPKPQQHYLRTLWAGVPPSPSPAVPAATVVR